MRRSTKRGDRIRLRAILQIIVEPFSDHDMDWMTTEHKLFAALQPEQYPIYRRKINRTMPVHGMWWMDEEQWARFLWNGFNAHVIRTNQDPDRVLTTKSFEKGFCYIRECGDHYDLEAMTKTTKWDPVKKKRIGDAYEWMTVSVTPQEFEELNIFLGPKDEGCKHC